MDIVDIVEVDTVEHVNLSPVLVLTEIHLVCCQTYVRLYVGIALRTREEAQLQSHVSLQRHAALVLWYALADNLCLHLVALFFILLHALLHLLLIEDILEA